jgi:hypothetical protein
LNSSASEIEAAAATLLVVVPANPWRAKATLCRAENQLPPQIAGHAQSTHVRE